MDHFEAMIVQEDLFAYVKARFKNVVGLELPYHTKLESPSSDNHDN